ncbi:MAG: hypothetical protein GTO45_33250 [Candidatus Aminicenantes bacterium]|nr:hypothetical protein [Candidatus Aminicenantes bacterium]NIM83604.1 hypothetical protein [Candidatus Aminicenantes bacterium]NIN23008.1 hypothetical protein [Candidatus Aminicenantes bacterium]NIN46745.1 hypothetical protein [Candidatus Aminicenantes bacterium]NIN89651.1 hypothetical protein [Candidatus Aminicenantes bacterium]
MNKSTKDIVKSVWVPLSHPFRSAIQEATEVTFEDKDKISTTSYETVLLKDVLAYNQKAEGPLTSTFQKLNSIERSDIAKIIQKLYPKLVPYFIDCGTRNPVHHTAYVMEYMVTILIGEGKHTESNVKIDMVKVGMLAALFHDSAQGLSKLQKITEANIKDMVRKLVRGTAEIKELKKCLNNTVKARQVHMEKGAEIAEAILPEYPKEINDDEIREIKRIIEHHDDPKIPVAYNIIRGMFSEDDECKNWYNQLEDQQKEELDSLLNEAYADYLIEINDWLLQYHHEADLLWMLTEDGIDADLARFSPTEKKTHREMIDNNIKCHKEEVELYKDRPDFEEYNFQNNTVYRSKTGYMLFEHLTRILNERYP